MLITYVTTECTQNVNLSTEDDRSFCRNMFCKFKSVVVFFKILTCLLFSRSFGNINYSVSIHASLYIHDIPCSHCMACVDETPKKIVESKLFCFLCGNNKE